MQLSNSSVKSKSSLQHGHENVSIECKEDINMNIANNELLETKCVDMIPPGIKN